MTEEELIKKMADLIDKENHSNLALPTRNISYQLITLIRESGVFMDMEMVKGLIFEVQAKKCANCPKNKEDDEVYDCPIHGTAHGGRGECPLC